MNLNNQAKVLWFGDLVTPSGFGRIGNEITKRLAMRGWSLYGLSVSWDGFGPSGLPFDVWGLSGVDIWQRLVRAWTVVKPDVVVVCQDFPYGQTAFRGTPIDWSATKFINITPIDGNPIHPDWLRLVDLADATMVISRFGVESMRNEGKQVELLHPGADTNEFYPAREGEVAALRTKMGIAPDAFVVGAFMMNQGRKAIPEVVELFYQFAIDKPNAVLFLDMEKTSPAGWDIPNLLKQMKVDASRVKYREDALKAELFGLRERILLCDINAQFAHREGFGLPILEAMACKVPSMAIDWCSGSELTGAGKGVLVRRLDYMSRGTWGGARDAFPDMPDALRKLETLYANRDALSRIASTGYEWAIQQTWDKATDQCEAVLRRVVEQQRKEREAHEPAAIVNIPAPGLSDIRGPAHPEHLDTSVQQPASGVPLHRVSDGNNQPPADAGDRLGRLQPGVRLDDAAIADGAGSEEIAA